MKTVSVLSLVILSLFAPIAAADEPPPLPAYTMLEQSNLVTGDGFDPNMNGQALRLFTPRLGVFSGFYVDRRYAAAYVGPAVAPAAWATLGCGAGVETTQEAVPWRAGCAAWLGTPTLSLVAVAETGASGPWGRAELNWRFVPWAGIGAVADLLVGVGPRIELAVPKFPFTVWYAPAYHPRDDTYNHLLGFRLVM